ncbi:hypothetical protein [Endozoicomonas sp. 8E]|uniref:hypothetical protein n=1 Tax=Endozoicomonas sp. 8E TaxID=3035692 RepID=UPI002938D00E|nr:hypothetical protein [Endozoicomonas sp. 8E]WOG29473.1 hypothetical protein P6910_07435 [Endozoicomonas sp. 8E]
MLPTRFAHEQALSILLALLFLMQTTHSFSIESSQTEPCSCFTGYWFPLAVLFVSAVTYYAWPETCFSPVSGEDESCSIDPFELWKSRLDREFCQSLISLKDRVEALELLRQTRAMQPPTVACNNWQANLADYFNWRWPGNNASQWQQIPVRGGFKEIFDIIEEADFIGILAYSPSVYSLNTIQINSQQFILKGYINSGLIIVPMLKVAECYFVPEEEPVAFGFDEWSGLIGGRIHSLFKAVKGSSLRDWVAKSRKPSSEVDLDALFSEFGQILAKFHLRHRTSNFNGIYTLSRAIHHDLNFNNVFYDEKSGFSLIDIIGLSVSVLEPSEMIHDLNQLFEDMNRSRISKRGFIRAYASQWPEETQAVIKEDLAVLQLALKSRYSAKPWP